MVRGHERILLVIKLLNCDITTRVGTRRALDRHASVCERPNTAGVVDTTPTLHKLEVNP